jgi:hypothetical protein
VSGHIEIAPGVTVTVEAGTSLAFEPFSTLYVLGGLVMAGTETEPVTVAGTVEGPVGGSIIFGTSSVESSFLNVSFDHISLHILGDSVREILGCTFDDADVRIMSQSQAMRLEGCRFSASNSVSMTLLIVNQSANVTVANSLFEGGQYGVQTNAGVDGDGVSIMNCEFVGQAYGIRAGVYSSVRTTLDVVGSRMNAALNYGIMGYNTDMTVTQTDINGVGITGIYGSQNTKATLVQTTVSGADGHCVQLYGDQSHSVTDSVFTDCGSDGIDTGGDFTLEGSTIDGTGGNCLDVNSDGLSVRDSTLSNCGSDGIESMADVTVHNTTVDTTGYYGIDAKDLLLTNSSVLNAAKDGVYVRGSEVSAVTDCNVENNGGYGVRGYTVGEVQLDVSTSNIVGNTRQGLYEVQIAEGNYLAGNYGFTGVDEEEGGTLDGSRNTDTDQIADADIIVSPAAERLESAGVSE